jgi:fructose-bisphosphate aldolase, class II
MELAKIKAKTSKARQVYQRARSEGFALGAFNIDNQETLVAVVQALQTKRAPAMVEVSHGEVQAMGLNNIRDMVDNYIAECGVELFINLDHAPSVDDAKAGIDAGFEFIHIDISQANHNASDQEIVNATKEVVEYAKHTGALVESEPHYFAGSSNLHDEKIDYQEIRKTFTKPSEAAAFIAATGIDTFAAAVGNLHGKYPVAKKLDIELLKEIRQAVPEEAFLSLHGGSGTPDHYYQEAIAAGVSKVNINTDLRFSFRKTLERVLKNHKDEYAVVKLMPEVIAAVQEVVEQKLDMFNAPGKAS